VLGCLYSFHHKRLVVSPTDKEVNLDATAVLALTLLEILTLSGSLVRPIRFVYLPFIIFLGGHHSLVHISFN
jgi:hypothetical protein